jgi:hypothetical protein
MAPYHATAPPPVAANDSQCHYALRQPAMKPKDSLLTLADTTAPPTLRGKPTRCFLPLPLLHMCLLQSCRCSAAAGLCVGLLLHVAGGEPTELD